MKIWRMVLTLPAFVTVLGNVATADAQVYPSRPITMVVTFPAGGGADVIGRVLAERMRVSLGQPVVIENVSGANGSIGVDRVARAAGDGYSLILGSSTTFVANGVLYARRYNLLTDFEPIALVTTQPSLPSGKK